MLEECQTRDHCSKTKKRSYLGEREGKNDSKKCGAVKGGV